MVVPTGESPLSAGVLDKNRDRLLLEAKQVARWFTARYSLKKARLRCLYWQPVPQGGKHEPHTEAMRLDEVSHHAEVPTSRKGGSTKIVDVAAIGWQGYSSYRGRSLDVWNVQEKSAEVIVATRNEP